MPNHLAIRDGHLMNSEYSQKEVVCHTMKGKGEK